MEQNQSGFRFCQVSNTVLGSSLFSRYINDISTDSHSEIKLSANECVCYREIKDMEEIRNCRRILFARNVSKNVWYKVPASQIQYDAADKQNDKKIDAQYTLERFQALKTEILLSILV